MSADLSDWRNQYVGKQVGTGNTVFLTAFGRWVDGKSIEFVMPSPSALILNAAFFAYSRSVTIRDAIVISREGSFIEDTPAIYDYIQAYLESIVHSFTTLEITCNLHISANDKLEVSKKRSTEIFEGEQIERWVHLDDKIEFVANKLGAEIDKSTAVWGNYKKLANMRDRIIHMKNSDRESHSSDEDNIWSFALTGNALHPCKVSLDVMNLLYSNKEIPVWLSEANKIHDSQHTT